MKELVLPSELSCEIAEIYDSMAIAYDKVASQISLTCDGCPDNCCDSFFLHYTYAEWAYLWEGIRKLEDRLLDRVMQRAREYVEQSRLLMTTGERPQLMCPLNERGRCVLCRMHGVPATLYRPDGQHLRFPGCFRCQEIVRSRYAEESDAPAIDRTVLYQRLAQLESRYLGDRRQLFPKVKLTIAEMIVNGPPKDIKANRNT
jgi:hypothetical protein